MTRHENFDELTEAGDRIATRAWVGNQDFNADSIIRLDEGDVINTALSSAPAEAVTVVLPYGVTYYDAPISHDYTVRIVGQGKHVSTLRAEGGSGNGRIDAIHSDITPASRVYSDMTIDMNHEGAGEGRLYYTSAGGAIDTLELSNVDVRNMTISASAANHGLIEQGNNGSIDHIRIHNGCEIRLDTFDTITDGMIYWALRAFGDETQETVHVADDTETIGAHVRDDLSDDTRMRGYQTKANVRAYIGGLFDRMTNYCCQAWLQGPESVAIAAGSSQRSGDGDQWEIRGTGGTGIFECEVGPYDGSIGLGDRGIITKDTPGQIVLRNPVIHDVLVPASFLGGFGSLSGTITVADSGEPDGWSGDKDDPGHMGIQIDSWYGEMGDIDLTVMVKNDTADRLMEPGIGLWDTHPDGGTWPSDTNVNIRGYCGGYETTMVEDNTPSGVSVDTSDLVDGGSSSS